nr:AAA family ATPase [Limnoraphis robusta]
MQLSDQQRQAVVMAAYSKILILTGGPGCGKTFTTATIVELWKAMGRTILLGAPTGRAAQRLGEMTKLPAKTLHRLLEFDPKTMNFSRDRDHPLDCDALIVDETSMLDIFLAYSQISGAVFSVRMEVADEVSGFGNGVGSDAGVLAIEEETSLKWLKSRGEFSDVQPIVITPLNPINKKNR